MLDEEDLNKTLNRLKNHPDIVESLKELLDVAEGIKGIEKAEDAEFALIPEVRGAWKEVFKRLKIRLKLCKYKTQKGDLFNAIVIWRKGWNISTWTAKEKPIFAPYCKGHNCSFRY